MSVCDNLPEIKLNILIKQEDDYYLAHSLEFDIVATDDTVEAVKKAIVEMCISHIQFSIENDNLEYLFASAPNSQYRPTIFELLEELSEIKIHEPVDIDIPLRSNRLNSIL